MADTNFKPPPSPGGAQDKDDDVIERRTLRYYYIILRERLWIALPLALIISIGYGYWRMRERPMVSINRSVRTPAVSMLTTEGTTALVTRAYSVLSLDRSSTSPESSGACSARVNLSGRNVPP